MKRETGFANKRRKLGRSKLDPPTGVVGIRLEGAGESKQVLLPVASFAQYLSDDRFGVKPICTNREGGGGGIENENNRL